MNHRLNPGSNNRRSWLIWLQVYLALALLIGLSLPGRAQLNGFSAWEAAERESLAARVLAESVARLKLRQASHGLRLEAIAAALELNALKLDAVRHEVQFTEADRNQVLPMDTTTFTRSLLPRPNLTAGRTVFNYSGEVTGTPNGNAPNLLASSYNIKAEIEVPAGGAEGMLVTQGGRFAGYGFYLLDSKPVYLWNLFGLQRIRWEGQDALTPGKHTLEFDFKYDGLGAATLQYGSPSGLGRSGTGYLKVDGKVVATRKMEKTIPMLLQWCESFDVGADTGSPVNDEDYQTPFRFNGKLAKLTLTIDRPELSPEDIKKLKMAMHNNSASE